MKFVGFMYYLLAFEIAFSVAIWFALKNEKVKAWWTAQKAAIAKFFSSWSALLPVSLFLLSPLSGFSQTNTSSVMSLQQCVEYAVSNHYSIKKANIDQEIFTQQRRETLAGGLPQINGTGTYTDNLKIPVQLIPAEIFGGEAGQFLPVQFGTKYNMSGGIAVEQLLYSHRFWKALEYAKAGKQVAALNREKAKEDVVYNVTIAYYQVQITQEQQKIVKNNLEQTQKLIEITELQVKNGVAKLIDLERIKINQTNLETDLSNLKLAYYQQLNLLKFYMNWEMNSDLVVQTLSVVENPANSFLIGGNKDKAGEVANRIDFKLLSQQKLLKALEIKTIKAEAIPSLSFFANNNYQSFGETFNFLSNEAKWFRATSIGLTLSVPIFDGFRRQARTQKARLELQQLDLEMNNLGQAINMQVDNAQKKMTHFQRVITTQDENRKLAEKVYQVTQDQYKSGVAGLTDLLNAETALKSAQSNYLNALTELKISEVELQKAKGILAN